MNKVVKKFPSFEAAQVDDDAVYKSMSISDKINEFLELLSFQDGPDETKQRLERVCRIIKQERR